MIARTLQFFTLRRETLNGATRHLAALNPEATLKRAYAIVRENKTGRVVKRKVQVAGRAETQVRVSDGEFEATTNEPMQRN